MSVAAQCVISWAVGVVAGTCILFVGCGLAGFELVRVKSGAFALLPGDVAFIRRGRRVTVVSSGSTPISCQANSC